MKRNLKIAMLLILIFLGFVAIFVIIHGINQNQEIQQPEPTPTPQPTTDIVIRSNTTTYFLNTTFNISPNNYSTPIYTAELPLQTSDVSNRTMSEDAYFRYYDFIKKSQAFLNIHIKTIPLSEFYIYKSETFNQKVEGETTIQFTDWLGYELHFGNPTNQTVTFVVTISASQTLVGTFWEEHQP